MERQQKSLVSKIPMAIGYLFRIELLIAISLFSLASLITSSVLGQAFLPLAYALFFLYIFVCFSSMSRIINGLEDCETYGMSDDTGLVPLKFIGLLIVLASVLMQLLPELLAPLMVLLSPYLPDATFEAFVYFIVIYLLVLPTTPIVSIILITNQDVMEACNPKAWLAYITSLGGKHYGLMLAVLLSVLALYAGALFFMHQLPLIVATLLSSLLTALLIGFHFTFIGFASRAESKEEGEQDRHEKDEDLRLANQTWTAGYREDAIQSLIITYQNSDDNDKKTAILARLESYFNESQFFNKHKKFINQLVDEILVDKPQDFELVAEFLHDVLRLNALLTADRIKPLAKLALENKDADFALKVTSNFAKRHSKHPDLPDNYFIAAKAYAQLEQYPQTYKLLMQLQKHFPEYKRAKEVTRLMRDIKRMVKR